MNGTNYENILLKLMQVSIIIATVFISLCTDSKSLLVAARGNDIVKGTGLKQINFGTFSIDGIIAGLIFTDIHYNTKVIPPDILYGDWHLHVNEGNLTEFLANFSMTRINGLEHHLVQINNFHRYPDANAIVRLDSKGSTSFITGLANVTIDNVTNSQVNTVILINKLRTVIINLPYVYNPETGSDIFRGKPITGLVNSFYNHEN
jgi:hypothetical protein